MLKVGGRSFTREQIALFLVVYRLLKYNAIYFDIHIVDGILHAHQLYH